MSNQVGGAFVRIDADTARALRAIREVNVALKSLESAKGLGRELFGQAERDAAKLKQTLQALQVFISKPIKGFDAVPQIDQTAAALQRYQAQHVRAILENQKFDATEREKQRLLAAGVPVVDRAGKAIQNFGNLQARAIRENEHHLPFLQKYSTAINQLAFAAARTGHGFVNFLPLIARVTTLLSKHVGGEDGLGGALARIRGAAPGAESGLKSLASGIGVAKIAAIAGTAALAALGVAIGFLAIKLGPLGGAIQTFRERLQVGFGDGAAVIQRFASTSAEQFGLTELAAIKLTGTIGNVFQSFGVGQERAAGFAVALADAALIIQRTSFTTDTYEQVLTKLKGALTGNVEALREYGIAVNEATIRGVAAQHGISLIPGELDAASKALLAEIFILDQANKKQDEFGKTTESVLTEQEKLTAALEEFKTAVGEDLVPIFRGLLDVGQGVISFFGDLYDEISSIVKPVDDFVREIEDLLNLPEVGEALFGDDSEKAFAEFAKSIGAIQEEISFLGSTFAGTSIDEQIEAFRATTNALFDDFAAGKIDADQFFTILAAGLDISPEEAQRQYRAFFNVIAQEVPGLEKYRDTLFDTSFAQDRLTEELRKHQAELRKTPEFMRKLIDAYEDLNDVVKENVERLKDAREARDEARIEGAKAIAEAEKDFADAKKDGAKAIIDAEDDLADARKDRIDALEDAQQAVDKAEKEAAKSIEKAEESLRDARLDSVKKVDDAERKLADARKQRRGAILNAQLSLFEALSRGDAEAENRARLELSRAADSDSVAGAQRDLAEARIEGSKEVAEAEEKLAEAIEEAEERISDAKERQREVIEEQNERIIDAKERLAEVYEDTTERIIEAHERVAEAEEKAAEQLKDARENLRKVRDENAERLEDARKKVLELEGQWEETNEELQVHLERLREINAEYLKLPEPNGPNAVTGGIVVERAHGGPVGAGHPYLIGERGPELFIPNKSGQVISNNQLLKVLREMYGAGGNGGSYTVVEAASPEATARAIEARMAMRTNN